MPSSFKSLDLFGSGPHRFGVLRQGQLIIPEFAVYQFGSGSLYYGLLELSVVVTGRLVAASEQALWTLRDAITGELLDPPAPGRLVDLHGRSWNDMSFVRFETADRTDRGRIHSIAYTARFIDLHTYPQGGDGAAGAEGAD